MQDFNEAALIVSAKCMRWSENDWNNGWLEKEIHKKGLEAEHQGGWTKRWHD